MKPRTLILFSIISAIIGIALGYFITLVFRPHVLPPGLRPGGFGGLNMPVTVLLMGVDIVYGGTRRGIRPDPSSFQGRSDTMMLARFDPIRNQFSVLSIPRDTTVEIPGHGRQKINGANAIGGETLACETVSRLTQIDIDHFVTLNVHGLVELVDKLGGITVQIPKRMRYRDRAAGLRIDLQPGEHLLTGEQAMGFVRFRHDALGDIGRVQRQEIFMHAVMDKAMRPESWAKLPELIKIAQSHVKTDLSPPQIMQILTFAKSVPKPNQHMIMMPGTFSSSGGWAIDELGLRRVTSMMTGQPPPAAPRSDIRISVENASKTPGLSRKLAKYLTALGYPVKIPGNKSGNFGEQVARTKVIAECGNPSDAVLVKEDLKGIGDVVSASLGDIESCVTVVAGDDLIPLLEAGSQDHKRHH